MTSNLPGVHALVWAAGWSSGQSEHAVAPTKAVGYDALEIPLLDAGDVDGPATKALHQLHAAHRAEARP